VTTAGAARVEQLAALAPHPGTAHHLAVTVEGPVVLARVAPGGSAFAARVVQAYDLLVTHLEPDAQLIVEGPLDEGTLVVLQEVLRRSNLPGGWLAGVVDDDVLVAFLGRADVCMLAPSDEPVSGPDDVERAEVALAFGLPVVGGPSAVLGDAGLALSRDDGVAVWAEAVATVLARPGVRRELANRARRRAAERLALPA